jgi:NH3-dependent NAD+ synthetase
VSTVDRSEELLGRQTECFYGQIAPIASLFKLEVEDLARALGVVDILSDPRPGCEAHWYDDEVFGVGYDVIDTVLHLLVDEQRTPEWIAETYGVADLGWIERVATRVATQPLRLDTRRAPIFSRRSRAPATF